MRKKKFTKMTALLLVTALSAATVFGMGVAKRHVGLELIKCWL